MAATPRLAFLGLGQMGRPMARRLVDSGYRVTVWNRSPDKAEPLTRAGAGLARTPGEAASGAEGVITMLATPEAVLEVMTGDGGVLSTVTSGQTIIEMSTIGPRALGALAERLPAGVDLVDAPVLGSVREAEAGELKVFVGGSEEQFARWGPTLSVLGAPRHVGPSGSGAAMKLVVNSTLGVLMAGLGEALALGRALGLDAPAMLDVLAESAIGVTAKSKRERILSGSYPPNFKVALAAKDLHLIAQEAERRGVPLRVSHEVKAWFEEAAADGFGELDYSAVIATILGDEARP